MAPPRRFVFPFLLLDPHFGRLDALEQLEQPGRSLILFIRTAGSPYKEKRRIKRSRERKGEGNKERVRRRGLEWMEWHASETLRECSAHYLWVLTSNYYLYFLLARARLLLHDAHSVSPLISPTQCNGASSF